MIALSHEATMLLDALRSRAFGASTSWNGKLWRQVKAEQLHNCGLTPRKFKWNLSALDHSGLYRKVDGTEFVCTAGKNVP